MAAVHPIDLITGAWLGVAPSGYAENVHSIIQKEIVAPNGRRQVAYPALVFTSVGVTVVGVTPDGRRHPQDVEGFNLDFRAETYRQARDLAEAFRQELGEAVVEWEVEPDDIGLELVLQGGGEMVPRRVVRVVVPYRREFG